jgi:hypothetical protein
VGGAASSVLPGRDVAAAFSWLLVGGAGQPANRLALRAAPVQPRLDPLGAAPGFLLGHPACERDQDILDPRGRVGRIRTLVVVLMTVGRVVIRS